MYKIGMKTLSTTLALCVAACGGSGTDSESLTEGGDDNPAGFSQLNPELDGELNAGAPGGDITTIAGLWDGTISNGGTNDVV